MTDLTRTMMDEIDRMLPGDQSISMSREGGVSIVEVKHPDLSFKDKNGVTQTGSLRVEADNQETALRQVVETLRHEANERARGYEHKAAEKTAIQLQAKMGYAPPDPSVPVPSAVSPPLADDDETRARLREPPSTVDALNNVLAGKGLTQAEQDAAGATDTSRRPNQ